MRLTELKAGEIAKILNIFLPNKFKKRLAELGIFDGVSMRVVLKSVNKKPLVIFVRGVFYALRFSDASNIEVKKL